MPKKMSAVFPPEIRPARQGVYQTNSEVDDGEPCFQHWNGEFWGLCGGSPEHAATGADWKSTHQKPTWRGLAKKS